MKNKLSPYKAREKQENKQVFLGMKTEKQNNRPYGGGLLFCFFLLFQRTSNFLKFTQPSREARPMARAARWLGE